MYLNSRTQNQGAVPKFLSEMYIEKEKSSEQDLNPGSLNLPFKAPSPEPPQLAYSILTMLMSFRRINSVGGLIGSMIACFFMGIVYEGLKFWREHLMRGNFRRVSSLLFSGFMFLSEDFAYLSLGKQHSYVLFPFLFLFSEYANTKQILKQEVPLK